MTRGRKSRQRGNFDVSFVATIVLWTAISAGCIGVALIGWGAHANTHALPGDHFEGFGRIGAGVVALLVCAVTGWMRWRLQ